MKKRSEVDRQYKWDVESIYSSPEEWEKDFARLDEYVEPILALRGKLTSPEAVAKVFQAEDNLGKFFERLFLYAHMNEDVDTRAGESQARMSRIKAQHARIAGDVAWIEPEILQQSEATLKEWMNSPELKDYRRSMQLLIRQKPHTLSAEEETLLGLASDVFSTPQEGFSKLANADLQFEPAVDSQGKEHEVTNGAFYSLLQQSDRTLRQNAFASIYKGYRSHENTLATLLSGSTKSHVFNANVRKFDGALEAALFNDNIPNSVYTSLIDAVHEALPVFHEYVGLRAKALELGKDINAWDFYVPIVPDFEMKVSWDECREWIMKATEPLGEEYQEAVKASFEQRWYDVYENEGKRAGAYSTGAYGQKPFMLLNYHETLDDVFTVAHELGHSVHTHFSHKYQPYRYSDYPIFLAEIASTTNEALLHHHLMETQDDPRLRAYLLNHLCDSFRGTLVRQTMFAEFELEIHRRLEKGEALTSESMKEFYYDLNAKYHGPNMTADDRIASEWSRVPHFYFNFYVYKYATGFAAAQLFAQQILSGKEGRDKYLGFLKSGSSKDPLDTVRDAGVDLADPQVVRTTFDTFRSAIRELSELLEDLPAKK